MTNIVYFLLPYFEGEPNRTNRALSRARNTSLDGLYMKRLADRQAITFTVLIIQQPNHQNSHHCSDILGRQTQIRTTKHDGSTSDVMFVLYINDFIKNDRATIQQPNVFKLFMYIYVYTQTIRTNLDMISEQILLVRYTAQTPPKIYTLFYFNIHASIVFVQLPRNKIQNKRIFYLLRAV